MSEDGAEKPKDEAEMQPPRAAATGMRKSAADTAFDTWLDRGLHAMYDDIAKEPIPPALLALIRRDREGG